MISIRYGGYIAQPYCRWQGNFGRIINTTASYKDGYIIRYTIKFSENLTLETSKEPERIYGNKPLFRKKINT